MEELEKKNWKVTHANELGKEVGKKRQRKCIAEE